MTTEQPDTAADRDDTAWSAFCDEAEQLLDRVEHTTKRMNGWLALCFLLAVIGWGVLLWALTR